MVGFVVVVVVDVITLTSASAVVYIVVVSFKLPRDNLKKNWSQKIENEYDAVLDDSLHILA